MASKPITNNPITNHQWPDKGGRKNREFAGKRPIKGDPIDHNKWPTDMGRKNT